MHIEYPEYKPSITITIPLTLPKISKKNYKKIKQHNNNYLPFYQAKSN